MNTKTDLGKVLLTFDERVAILTLSRPNALNAITWEMYTELENHLDNLQKDSNIRVLIIKGDGEKALAAGTDISQFQGFNGEDGINYEKRIDTIIKKIETFPKPTIAAIQGIAVGGGLIISTACDLRYSNSKGKFGAPMSKTLGNCLSLQNYIRLERELGRMRTKELLYTSRLITAKEAFDAGFLTATLEDENFFTNVINIAKKISQRAPLTVDTTKKAFVKIDEYNESSIKDDFNPNIYEVYNSNDFKEGVNAYLEKRSPVWTGL